MERSLSRRDGRPPAGQRAPVSLVRNGSEKQLPSNQGPRKVQPNEKQSANSIQVKDMKKQPEEAVKSKTDPPHKSSKTVEERPAEVNLKKEIIVNK